MRPSSETEKLSLAKVKLTKYCGGPNCKRCGAVGSITPVFLRAFVACVCVTPGAAMVHSVPPLNSMPRLSPPRNTIEMIPRTMMAVEMLNQILRLPTKSKRVSPR